MFTEEAFMDLSPDVQHAVILIGIGESFGIQQALFMEDATALIAADPDASIFPARMAALSRMGGVNRNIETAEQKMSAECVEALNLMYEQHVQFIGNHDPRTADDVAI